MQPDVLQADRAFRSECGKLHNEAHCWRVAAAQRACSEFCLGRIEGDRADNDETLARFFGPMADQP